MNVGPTVETIKSMASRLRHGALELERIAKRMEDHQDITYASEAMTCISNGIMNLRLDLLVTRPLREAMRGYSKQSTPADTAGQLGEGK